MRRAIMLVAASVGLSCLACTGTGLGQAKEKQEKEEKISIDQVPEAARKTLQEEAKGAAIREVEKEMEKGKAVYEATVEIKGKTYEIEVAEDGTLLEKSLSDPADEAKDDDDDEEDDD